MVQNNVLADALSRPNQIQGSEWMLKMEVFNELQRLWPVMVDLFATSANRRYSLFFSFPRSPSSGDGCAAPQLGPSPGVCVPSVGLDSSGPSQAPLVVRCPDDTDSSVLASTSLVSGPSGSGSGLSDCPSSLSRSSQTATLSSSSSRGPQAVALCVETIQRFARAAGVSSDGLASL